MEQKQIILYSIQIFFKTPTIALSMFPQVQYRHINLHQDGVLMQVEYKLYQQHNNYVIYEYKYIE